MDAVGELELRVPEHVEMKRLAGRVVWLRHGAEEWVGPAEEALALLRDREPETAFWSAFA